MDINTTHGKKTDKSEKVGRVIINDTELGFEKHIFKNKEKIYKSEVEKPHGQSFKRNFNFPIEVNEPDFQFGIKT